MAAPVLNIQITFQSLAVASEIAQRLMKPANQAPQAGVNALASLVSGIAAMQPGAGVAMFVDGGNGVKASGTVTLSGGGPAAADTVTIAGEVFTYRVLANPANRNEITIKGTLTLTAAETVLVVNRSAIAQGQVVATNAAGVITLTARAPGLYGNGITLAKSGANIAVSAAALASGTASTGIAGGAYFASGI